MGRWRGRGRGGVWVVMGVLGSVGEDALMTHNKAVFEI